MEDRCSIGFLCCESAQANEDEGPRKRRRISGGLTKSDGTHGHVPGTREWTLSSFQTPESTWILDISNLASSRKSSLASAGDEETAEQPLTAPSEHTPKQHPVAPPPQLSPPYSDTSTLTPCFDHFDDLLQEVLHFYDDELDSSQLPEQWFNNDHHGTKDLKDTQTFSIPTPDSTPPAGPVSYSRTSDERRYAPRSTSSRSHTKIKREHVEATPPDSHSYTDLPSRLGYSSTGATDEKAEVKAAVQVLMNEMRSCLSPDGNISAQDRFYGTALSLYGNGITFATEGRLGQCDNDKVDILRVSQDVFLDMMMSGHPPTKPVIIERDPKILTGASQLDTFLNNLLYGYAGSMVDVQNMSAHLPDQVTQFEASELHTHLTAHRNATLTRAQWPRNLLNLHGMMTSAPPPPAFSLPPSANVLRYALFRRRAALAGKSAGKGGALTPYQDIDHAESCLSFSLLSQRGSFSGCHMDVLAGTWVRSLYGRKLWPLCFDLDARDWEAFRAQGPGWVPPAQKLRAALIREGEVLVMPPCGRWVHAPLTFEDCLMDGGMFWTGKDMGATLDTLAFLKENIWTVTNEELPLSLPGILDGAMQVLATLPEELRPRDMEGVRARAAELKRSCKRDKNLGKRRR